MGVQYWINPLVSAPVDGTAITSTAATSCIPTAAKYTLPSGFFDRVGKQLRITASGQISCAVTTPGTARYDVRFGSTVVFDGLAVPLNIVAKTSVGWWLEILLTCRSVGGSTAATLFGQGRWTSEAVIGSPAATAGSNGVMMLPFNSAPAVGTGFDSTATQVVDLFFTQTVSTGSMTLRQYLLEEIG